MTGRLWPFWTGMVKLARQPASGGRPENSTVNLLGLATLVVCLLDAKMPEVLADTRHETNNFR